MDPFAGIYPRWLQPPKRSKSDKSAKKLLTVDAIYAFSFKTSVSFVFRVASVRNDKLVSNMNYIVLDIVSIFDRSHFDSKKVGDFKDRISLFYPIMV